MNYGKRAVSAQRRASENRLKKAEAKTMLLLMEGSIVVVLLAVAICVSMFMGAVKGIIEEAPSINEIDISPKGLESTIYDNQGNPIQTLVGSGANRSLVTYDQIPKDLINAFVSIEDERFWQHSGIDMRGILRATYEAVSNGFHFSQGASTITQQLIKNNVFGGGSEHTTGTRFIRKIQEQHLALELENVFSKETILENYLNTINLGSNCLGVQKAAERYFNKDVGELTLSECAVIAAITQNPYGYNPIRFPQKNAERMERVLEHMVKAGCITETQKTEALADNVYERIASVNEIRKTETKIYTFFEDRLVRDILRDLQELGYTYDQAKTMLYSGGLQIYSTQDPDIQAIVDKEVNDPENFSEITQKFSFTYALSVTHEDGSVSNYETSNIRSFANRAYMEFDTKEEIYELADDFKKSVVTDTDTVSKETVDISLQPQISVTVIDQSTGQVKAIAGGRGEKTASLSLNRATNTFRQPGSTFKVLASFAPALNEGGATLATTFYDEPYTTYLNGVAWSPKNWYSKNRYAGYATIRQAITYSMNIVAVKCLVEDVGAAKSYEYVEKFGINTLIPETNETRSTGVHDVRATLALGGLTQGVTNMQLTAAYATIANNGIYNEPILYTKILDSNGQIILDNTPETHRAITEETAFLLTSAMADSLEESRLNGLFSSSSPEAKLSTLPAAGKSGTTSSYNDLWFVGYTPYYTIGIWSGFDDNTKFEDSDNRQFHKVIWRKIMEQITTGKPYKEFTIPPNMVECRICTKSGLLAGQACELDPREDIIRREYFVAGTEPEAVCSTHVAYQLCEVSKLLPSPYCTKRIDAMMIVTPDGSDSYTDDSNYSWPQRETCTRCAEELLKQTGEDPTLPTDPADNPG